MHEETPLNLVSCEDASQGSRFGGSHFILRLITLNPWSSSVVRPSALPATERVAPPAVRAPCPPAPGAGSTLHSCWVRGVRVVGRCRLIVSTPALKVAWFQRLKLTCDESLLSFAFKFNLHHYSVVREGAPANVDLVKLRQVIMVGQCRLTLSNLR